MPIAKKYLFLIRSFNDLDHRAPLIHYICRSSSMDIEVLFIGPSRLIANNPNIIYLKKLKNFKLFILFNTRLKINIKYLFIFKKFNKIISRIFDKFFYDHTAFYNLNLNKFSNFKAIICDWVYPPSDLFNFLMKIKKFNKIKIHSLPHGISLWTNIYYVDKKIIKNMRMNIISALAKDNFFDNYVIPSKHMLRIEKSRKIPSSKIYISGCIRFSKYWINHLKKIYTEETIFLTGFIKKNYKKKYKNIVVIFLHKPVYNEKISALKSFFNSIGQINNTLFLIKGHTRGSDYKAIYKGINFNFDNFINMSNYSSYSLLKISNYSIVYNSSIAIQSLQLKIQTIIPTYLDKNKNILAEMLPSNIVKNNQQLNEILLNRKNINNQKEISKFLNYITGFEFGNPIKNIIKLIK